MPQAGRGDPAWLETRAVHLQSWAEEHLEVARELRAAADGLTTLAPGIHDRITPELWQGRSAEQRAQEAADWRTRLARHEDEIEELARVLDGRAEQASDEADGLRQRASLIRATEASGRPGP